MSFASISRRRAAAAALLLAAAAALLLTRDRAPAPPSYVGWAACARCHERETAAWKGSDHERAMDAATPATVLGDFNDALLEEGGASWRMSRRGDAFQVTTQGPSGRPETFDVKYVFGIRPLQQYLVALDRGRLQALTVAWDAGGKRWFHLRPGEGGRPGDYLHWTGAGYNWNYMCAECHSTDLRKNYDPASRSYRTAFHDVNVSCEGCHGPGSLHVRWAQGGGGDGPRGLADLEGGGNRAEVEACAKCHALRHSIHPGHDAGDAFLDHFIPELLDTEAYHPDGQIREESYEWGSFVQSRMHAKGVRCSDCHDPHTARVRAEGNALCARCHAPDRYDAPGHHHHAAGSAGARCVACHMRVETYMGVDPRRDHSFRAPRPDLSADLRTPNACNDCHRDRDAAWARDRAAEWMGGPREGPRHFAYAIAAGRAERPGGDGEILSLLARGEEPPFVRASALALLRAYPTAPAREGAREALSDPEPLIRAVAARNLDGAPGPGDAARLAALLDDPVRLVRTEAAVALAGIPGEAIPEAARAARERVLAEYIEGQIAFSDDAVPNHNLGLLHARIGEFEKAEGFYREALRLDPAFVGARQNLAMLLSERGRRAEAEAEFRALIGIAPAFADGHYSLGLLLAEGGRLKEAADSLAEAARLAPGRARVRYNLGLALDRLRREEEAERELRAAAEIERDSPDFLYALFEHFYRRKRLDEAARWAEALARAAPGRPEFRALREQVERERAAAPGP